MYTLVQQRSQATTRQDTTSMHAFFIYMYERPLLGLENFIMIMAFKAETEKNFESTEFVLTSILVIKMLVCVRACIRVYQEHQSDLQDPGEGGSEESEINNHNQGLVNERNSENIQ